MKTEPIPNKGPASLGSEFVTRLEWATCADMASAFVGPVAVRMLKTALDHDRNNRQLRIRLVVGVYGDFTEPAVLRGLLQLHKNDPVRFRVRVARNQRFHWKFYSFSKGTANFVYVGSGNFTNDGLKASGELAIRIKAKTHDTISRALQDEFDNLWSEDSFNLESRFIREYDHGRKPPSRVSASKASGYMSRWLEPPTRHPQPPPIRRSRPRVLFVDDFLNDETTEFVESQTDWRKHHWNYTCFPYKQDFTNVRNAGLLLLVERSRVHRSRKYLIELSRVRASVQIETDEGKYFVAHSRVPRGWCVGYDKVLEDLARAGLEWKAIKADTSLNEKQIGILSRLLHVRPETLSSA